MKPIVATFLKRTNLLAKMASKLATPKRRVDSQDLKAFDDSFTSDDSFDELLILKTNPINQTPVKKHNKIFENDFNSEFSEDEDNNILQLSLESVHIKSQNNTPVKQDSQMNLFSSPRRLIPNVSQSKKSSPIKISDPEISSPTFHRTETLYKSSKAINQPTKVPTSPPLFTSTLIPGASPSKEPPSASPGKQSPEKQSILYPKLDEYNKKYMNSPTFPRPPTLNLPGLITPRANTPKQNSHIFLSTQRPSYVDFDRLASRPMSTLVDQPIDEDKITNKRIFKDGVYVNSHDRKTPKLVKAITLSEEQEKIQDLVLEGKNIFYTGSAGTGKSILLRSIIKSLKSKYGDMPGAVAVTASTGLAAVNIGGTTLHSFAGIGLGKESYQELVKKIRRSQKSKQKWQACKVLIIDEISMISGELFDKLDQIACTLKRNDHPFGGIQIVACGDFFQLPPVIKDSEDETNRFCFSSHSWGRTMDVSISLTTVFRQKGDDEFIKMLNDMRLGVVTPHAVEKFRELERELPNEDGIIPAELFPTRAEVERANNYRLKCINQPSELYMAYDSGSLENKDHRERLLSNFMAPERLELKRGAQVMMIKNMDESLVNGSLGRVVDFIDQATYLSYKALEEDLNADEQDLLRKSLAKRKKDIVKDDPEFDPTADYVPLEDISSDGLEDTVFDFLNEIQTDDAEAQENIQLKKKLIKSLKNSSRGQKSPLVKFLTPDGTSRTVLVQSETWTVEDEKGTVLVSRIQLPLILAWSISIHKSQGQTLPKVRVNLGKIFEKGQAYVALSRAVSREGLQVLNFNKDKVFVHPEVLRFYETLKDVYYYLNKIEAEEGNVIEVSGDSDEAYHTTEEYFEEDDSGIVEPRSAINKKRRLHK